MKIEFCLAKNGDVVFTKESNDLKSVINVITRVGTEINLTFSKEDFIHGYVSNVMYNVDGENNEESVKIFIDKNYHNNIHHEKLESIKLETAKLTTTKLK